MRTEAFGSSRGDGTETSHPRGRPSGWRLRWLGAAVVLALLAPAVVRADVPPPAAPAAAPAGAAVFSGEAAFRHVSYLAETIGSRPAGSDREAEAAAYVAGELARYGYQTEIQTFPIQIYEERSARVVPIVPRGEPIDTAALLYSGAGEVAGELVDAGLGREGDWAPGALAGRVALIERGEIPFVDKVANVTAAGAIAAVIFNNTDGRFTANLRSTSRIPALTLTREQGLALRERLRSGAVRVEVAVDAEVTTRQSRNVVGMLPGRRPGAVVVGGHFDSVPAGPGANDNASGTGTVLELARVFAERGYPYTLYFVAFGAEEIGLRGSRHFVDTLSEPARQQLRAMLNLDMVGVGDEQRLSGAEELVDMARAAAEAIAIPRYAARGAAGPSSDHESFHRVGVPVLFIHRSPDPNYHTPRDRAEYVDAGYLALAGQLVIGVLDRLAAEER